MAYQNKTARRREVPQTEPLLVSVRQASAMLGGVGAARIKAYIKSGKLDGVLIGVCHFVKIQSLKDLAEHGDATPMRRRPRASAPRAIAAPAKS